MKRKRVGSKKQSALEDVPQALAAYGERFMSMFDDVDDEQPLHMCKRPAAAEGSPPSPSTSEASSFEEDSETSETENDEDDSSMQARKASHNEAGPSAANDRLEEFLSRRKGSRQAAKQPISAAVSEKQQLAQKMQQEQQRLLERKLKKQFMSSKVSKIFDVVDTRQLESGVAVLDEPQELTAAEFAAMKRDVEQLGASALDKRSAKAWKASMLSKLGAAAEKRPRIPAKMGLGMAKKAKQREAMALQEAIAAGMVKAKGRGKKTRAEKAKQRDKGLMEAGPGFKNGVLRLPKSALK